jgi:hypothetical protein
VAPSIYQTAFSAMNCTTNSEAVVTMQYKISGSTDVIDGVVNYLIIGIKGNNNLGELVAPPPLAACW